MSPPSMVVETPSIEILIYRIAVVLFNAVAFPINSLRDPATYQGSAEGSITCDNVICVDLSCLNSPQGAVTGLYVPLHLKPQIRDQSSYSPINNGCREEKY
jgi:hypothetical protein